MSRHDIAAIWVAFFSRCQRYRCWLTGLRLDFPKGQLEVFKNGNYLGVMCSGMSFRHWLWQTGGCCWCAELWNSAVRVGVMEPPPSGAGGGGDGEGRGNGDEL